MLSDTGRLDVLCNNAGIGSTADPLTCTVQEWDRVFAVNARGTFIGTRSALLPMLQRGSGAIVNTASVAGMVGLRDRTAYCASKGAVIALTKQVAIQYAGSGVRCNCICPGTVDSPWVGRLLGQAPIPCRPAKRWSTGSPWAASATHVRLRLPPCIWLLTTRLSSPARNLSSMVGWSPGERGPQK